MALIASAITVEHLLHGLSSDEMALIGSATAPAWTILRNDGPNRLGYYHGAPTWTILRQYGPNRLGCCRSLDFTELTQIVHDIDTGKVPQPPARPLQELYTPLRAPAA